MTLRPVNGNFRNIGFNSHRFGCCCTHSPYGNMSCNGSIYGPRYNYAPGYIGTYPQFVTPEPYKPNFWDYTMTFLSGMTNAVTNNLGGIVSLIAMFKSDGGNNQG